MKKHLLIPLLLSVITVYAADLPPVTPRDSNFNNSGGYDSSRIEAILNVHVKDETDTVHFIRDNNDPRVVTKTYLLKHADPYELRDYLRQMVQAKRVGNTSMQQIFPMNTAAMPYQATVGAPSAGKQHRRRVSEICRRNRASHHQRRRVPVQRP